MDGATYYFVYPALMLIALIGANTVYKALRLNRKFLFVAAVALVAALATIVRTMISAHPIQNAYFNELAGKNWKANFDLDYWGLGNREAVEFLLAHDNRPTISIMAASSTPLAATLDLILSPSLRGRVKLAKSQADADYILNNYRDVGDKLSFEHKVFYQKLIGDEVIVTVYKVDQPSQPR